MSQSTVLFYTSTGGTNYVHPAYDPLVSTIEVRLDGIVQTTGFTITGGEVVFAVAPPAQTLIALERKTEICSRLVNFNNSSILDDATQNLDSNQFFDLAQELHNVLNAGGVIRKDELNDNNWDAAGLRIRNAADAVDPGDLTTFSQVKALIADPLSEISLTSVEDYADWNTAVDALNADTTKKHTLIHTASYTANANVTVLPHVTLWFVGDGNVDNSGHGIIIQGDVQAGRTSYIFRGSGTWTSTGVLGQCYPEWFGATSAPGNTTDSQPAINKAIDFLSLGGYIDLNVGRY